MGTLMEIPTGRLGPRIGRLGRVGTAIAVGFVVVAVCGGVGVVGGGGGLSRGPGGVQFASLDPPLIQSN